MNRRTFITRSLGLSAAAITAPAFAFAQSQPAAQPAAPKPAPNPAAAARQANAEPITAVEIAPGHTMLSGAGGNVSVLHGAGPTVVIDSGLPPRGADLLTKATELSGPAPHSPPRLLINTHYHFDHAGGNEPFGLAGTTIVSTVNCRQRLVTEQFIETFNLRTTPAPLPARPTITFAQPTEIHYADQTLELFPVPPAHTDGDLAVFIRPSNVLHTGDLFFNGFYPFIDYSAGGSIARMVAAADILLAKIDASTIIIPGHGPKCGKAEYQAFREMLAKLSDRVNTLADQGKTLEDALAANVTADTDEAWGKGLFQGRQFIAFVYKGELANRKR
jgi:glyoxylase-like metal-dependent hydrolase (beta-lactamase superfamily II)